LRLQLVVSLPDVTTARRPDQQAGLALEIDLFFWFAPRKHLPAGTRHATSSELLIVGIARCQSCRDDDE